MAKTLTRFRLKFKGKVIEVFTEDVRSMERVQAVLNKAANAGFEQLPLPMRFKKGKDDEE